MFAQIFDADVGKDVGHVLHEVAEDGFFIIADDEDFFDLGDFGYGAKAVFDNRVAGDVEEGLSEGCQSEMDMGVLH